MHPNHTRYFEKLISCLHASFDHLLLEQETVDFVEGKNKSKLQ